MLEIEVTQEFLDHRTAKSKLYNKRGRTMENFLKDLDCELFEWYMMNHSDWIDIEDDWRIDAETQEYGKVDVKFIQKWYNISCTKMMNHLQQQDVLDGYLFMEWGERPPRPLELGDIVTVNEIGFISYDTLRSLIKVSYGKYGGFYVDVRKYFS